MDYFDIYKKRLKLKGDNKIQAKVNATTRKINRNFEKDPSFRNGIINLNKENNISCRFSENKTNLFLKYFLFKSEDIKKINIGSYITIEEGIFLLSEWNMSEIYRKAEAYICNQVLKAKGLKDMPCYADNTSYGVKGLKDNNYYKESDKKLKIKVQANNTTIHYYEGQRFLFNSKSSFIDRNKSKDEWICYEIIAKDFTVLQNQYVLELVRSTLIPSKDDLINGIAYNENLNIKNDVLNNNEFGTMIKCDSKIKVGEIKKININPIDAKLIVNNNRIKLSEISEGIYKMIGIRGQGYTTVKLIKNNKELISKNILVY